jgi:hypothetical protein
VVVGAPSGAAIISAYFIVLWLSLLLLPGMVGHRAAPTVMVLAAAGYGWTPCGSYCDGPCCCCSRVWLDTVLLLLRWSLLLLPGMAGHRAALTGMSLLLLPGMVGRRAAPTGMVLAAAGYG